MSNTLVPTNFFPFEGTPSLEESGPMTPDVKKPQVKNGLPPIDDMAFDWHYIQNWMSVGARQLARDQQLKHYITNIRNSGKITNDVAILSWEAWQNLSKTIPIFVPDAAAGPNGEFIYAWDKNEHHLELEIFPDGVAELFYRNRISSQLWDADYKSGQVITHDIEEKLRLFTF